MISSCEKWLINVLSSSLDCLSDSVSLLLAAWPQKFNALRHQRTHYDNNFWNIPCRRLPLDRQCLRPKIQSHDIRNCVSCSPVVFDHHGNGVCYAGLLALFDDPWCDEVFNRTRACPGERISDVCKDQRGLAKKRALVFFLPFSVLPYSSFSLERKFDVTGLFNGTIFQGNTPFLAKHWILFWFWKFSMCSEHYFHLPYVRGALSLTCGSVEEAPLSSWINYFSQFLSREGPSTKIISNQHMSKANSCAIPWSESFA